MDDAELDGALVVQGYTDDAVAFAMESLVERASRRPPSRNPVLRRLRPGASARVLRRKAKVKPLTQLGLRWYWEESHKYPDRQDWNAACTSWVKQEYKQTYGIDLLTLLTIAKLILSLITVLLRWLQTPPAEGYLAANQARMMRGTDAKGSVQSF